MLVSEFEMRENGERGVAQRSQTYRVLVVDYEAAVRRLVADGLTELGFHVTTASDGGEAQVLLSGARFDALILDLQMAPVGGWEVVEHVRDNNLDVVTILLSAYLDVEGTVAALRAGVFDVLQKPLRLVELSSRIRDGIQARQVNPGEDEGSVEQKSHRMIRVAPVRVGAGPERLRGQSEMMQRLRDQVLRMGRFREVPTHIVGSAGTGKNLLARVIHDVSCSGAPFVSLSCGALPASVIENELFGYEAGVLPGSRGAKTGALEAAAGGTLFLSDIEALPLAVQGKFALALEKGSFSRAGSSEERAVSARVVSSTSHQNLADEPSLLRPDLYSRLSGLTLRLPDLVERMGDIEELATHFLQAFSKRYPGLPTRFEESALSALYEYRWPGNVWELRAVIEQAAVLSAGRVISGAAVNATLSQRGGKRNVLPAGTDQGFGEGVPSSGAFADIATSVRGVDLNAVQRKITVDMFNEHGRNLARTARALGIPRTTLRDRLRRYGEL